MIEQRVYRPAGPILRRFHQDHRVWGRFLIGPYGSGKTSACCEEIQLIGQRQAPDRHGVRRTRGAIVRATYGRILSNFLPTFEKWFSCRVTRKAPMHAVVRSRLDDGTRMEIEIWFIALDNADDVTLVEGMELTWVYFNEARELHWHIVDKIRGRAGRYPDESVAPLTWFGIFGDTNCPDRDHWLWVMKDNPDDDWRFYHQPGGLIRGPRTKGPWTWFHGDYGYRENPFAENIMHLAPRYDYYAKMLGNADDDTIKVNVLSEPGNLFTGRPVYDMSWNERVHVATEPLVPDRNSKLYFGWDYGNTPATILVQVTRTGQTRVLREFWNDNSSVESFADHEVSPGIAGHDVLRMLPRKGFGDPSGRSRVPTDNDTCEKALNRRGFNVVPANTNDWDRRRRAVVRPLERMVRGEPALIVDRSCKRLIDGFNGGYQYARVRDDKGAAKYKNVVEKNEFSHIHDALQYVLMEVLEPEGGLSSRAVDPVLPVTRATTAGRM